jgi:hypothetical protein
MSSFNPPGLRRPGGFFALPGVPNQGGPAAAWRDPMAGPAFVQVQYRAC